MAAVKAVIGLYPSLEQGGTGMLGMPSREQRFPARLNFVLAFERQRNAGRALGAEILGELQGNFLL